MPTGGAKTALRARPAVVAVVLVRQAPVMACLTALPALVAAFEQAWPLALALGAPCLAMLGLAIATRQAVVPEDLRRGEGIVAFAGLFLVGIVLALPGFLTLGFGPVGAVFEATSALTTTGLSVAADTADWPVAAHVLRGWLQWCGGLAIAVGGSAVLLNPGRAARNLAEPAIGNRDLHHSARTQARLVLLAYIALTLLALPASFWLFPGLWEGPVVVFAAVSTGGFTPRPDSLASYGTAAQAFTIVICVLGVLPLLLYFALAQAARGRSGEVPPLRPVLAALACGLLAALLASRAGASKAAPVWDTVFMQLSAQTTAGFSITAVDPAAPTTLPFLLGMVVGGAIGSTSGGIKSERAALLLDAIRQTLWQMRQPGRAIMSQKGQPASERLSGMTLAAALLLCHLLTVCGVWAALMATGAAPMASLFDAVSAVSCVGLGTGVIGADLPEWAQIVVSLGMLLGRLEFFALLALILPATWRRPAQGAN